MKRFEFWLDSSFTKKCQILSHRQLLAIGGAFTTNSGVTISTIKWANVQEVYNIDRADVRKELIWNVSILQKSLQIFTNLQYLLSFSHIYKNAKISNEVFSSSLNMK